MLNQFIEKIKSEPKRLFFIDGMGAMLSSFLLGVVMVRFERIFGIPTSTLYFLAILAIFLALYDFLSYRIDNFKIALLLKGIATMNMLYGCISLGFVFYHIDTIKISGWIYILVESSIVIALAMTELRFANRL